jgi:glycosyltransferase involved in cell wall biosynthesis
MIMKVVFVHRQRRRGAYSIEGLFRTVASELREQVQTVEYEAGSRWHILRDIRRLRSLQADVYHVTGDVHYLAFCLPAKKTVLTVHDINHYLRDLRGIKRWIYKWIWLMWPIRTAGAVTAVSIETRENIVRHLAISDRPIDVIENCHSDIFRPVQRPFNESCPVILQIGTQPHKNVPRLAEALQGIRCRLVLIGRLEPGLKKKLAECGVDYESHEDLTQEQLYRQYVDCDMVTFVSLAEGFGVPIIEAQATGRPLVTTDISPMRDVARDGACLVDPFDVSQIREGILRIIGDSKYRSELVDRGLRNVARYSPAAVSGRYLELYRRALGQ